MLKASRLRSSSSSSSSGSDDDNDDESSSSSSSSSSDGDSGGDSDGEGGSTRAWEPASKRYGTHRYCGRCGEFIEKTGDTYGDHWLSTSACASAGGTAAKRVRSWCFVSDGAHYRSVRVNPEHLPPVHAAVPGAGDRSLVSKGVNLESTIRGKAELLLRLRPLRPRRQWTYSSQETGRPWAAADEAPSDYSDLRLRRPDFRNIKGPMTSRVMTVLFHKSPSWRAAHAAALLRGDGPAAAASAATRAWRNLPEPQKDHETKEYEVACSTVHGVEKAATYFTAAVRRDLDSHPSSSSMLRGLQGAAAPLWTVAAQRKWRLTWSHIPRLPKPASNSDYSREWSGSRSVALLSGAPLFLRPGAGTEGLSATYKRRGSGARAVALQQVVTTWRDLDGIPGDTDVRRFYATPLEFARAVGYDGRAELMLCYWCLQSPGLDYLQRHIKPNGEFITTGLLRVPCSARCRQSGCKGNTSKEHYASLGASAATIVAAVERQMTKRPDWTWETARSSHLLRIMKSLFQPGDCSEPAALEPQPKRQKTTGSISDSSSGRLVW